MEVGGDDPGCQPEPFVTLFPSLKNWSSVVWARVKALVSFTE